MSEIDDNWIKEVVVLKKTDQGAIIILNEAAEWEPRRVDELRRALRTVFPNKQFILMRGVKEIVKINM